MIFTTFSPVAVFSCTLTLPALLGLTLINVFFDVMFAVSKYSTLFFANCFFICNLRNVAVICTSWKISMTSNIFQLFSLLDKIRIWHAACSLAQLLLCSYPTIHQYSMFFQCMHTDAVLLWLRWHLDSPISHKGIYIKLRTTGGSRMT